MIRHEPRPGSLAWEFLEAASRRGVKIDVAYDIADRRQVKRESARTVVSKLRMAGLLEAQGGRKYVVDAGVHGGGYTYHASRAGKALLIKPLAAQAQKNPAKAVFRGPAIVPSNVKRTIGPTFDDYRFVDPTKFKGGEFSRMGIGRYMEEA
jgi:hypothetical protein